MESKETFNYEEIYSESESLTGKIKWEDVYKIGEDKNSIYIFISKIQAVIIPKRYFSTEEDVNILKKIIEEKLEKSKIKFYKESS